MLFRLWLQRGRLLVLLGATLLASVIPVVDLVAAYLDGHPKAITRAEVAATRTLSEIAALTGIGLAVLVGSVMLPKVRSVIDLLAIIIVLRSLLWSLAPGLMDTMTSGPIPNLLFFMSLGFLVPRLIHHPWVERLLPGDVLLREKRKTIHAPVGDVWAAISLVPHDSARHYDRTLMDVVPGPGGTLVEHFPTVPALNGRVSRILETRPNRVLRLVRRPSDPDDDREMEVRITLVPQGDRTEVIWREAITRPLVIERLCHLLDDDLADDMHRLASWVEGRRDWSLYTAQYQHLHARPGAMPPPVPG